MTEHVIVLEPGDTLIIRNGEQEPEIEVPKPEKKQNSGSLIISKYLKYVPLDIDQGSTHGTLNYRNCNPGNLRRPTKWKPIGLADPDFNRGFLRFESAIFGAAAMCHRLRQLQGYRSKPNLLKAIKIWAPESDGNNPRSYANIVAKGIGAELTDKLSILGDEQLADLMKAMSIHEGSDVNKWPEAIWDDAVKLEKILY